MGDQRRRVSRRSGVRLLPFVVAFAVLAAPLSFPVASAAFTGSTPDDGNSLSAAEVQPPSGLAVTQQCSAAAPAPVYRSASGTNGTNSITLSVPSGTSAGHLMIAVVSNRDNFPLPTPSGWNFLRRDTKNDVVFTAMFWRIATASESSVTFSLTGASNSAVVGGILTYSGASTTAPVHAHDATVGVGTTATSSKIKTTVANARIVHFMAKREDTLPAPSGTNSRGSSSVSGTGGLGVTASDEGFPGPGTATARSATSSSGSSTEWVATSIAIAPPPPIASAAATWTATPTTWATGYVLERLVGGSVQSSQTVTPSSTTSAGDGPLVNGTAYTYRLRAYRGTWTSPDVTATLTPAC